MTKKKDPNAEINPNYIPFDYVAWLSSARVKDMSRYEVACYWDLLIHCFTNGGFPDDVHYMAVVCNYVRDQDMRRWWAAIKDCFYWDEEFSQWRNHKMGVARVKAVEAHLNAAGKFKGEESPKPPPGVLPPLPKMPFPKPPQKMTPESLHDHPGVTSESLQDHINTIHESLDGQNGHKSPEVNQPVPHVCMNVGNDVCEESESLAESPESPHTESPKVSETKVVAAVIEDWKALQEVYRSLMGYRAKPAVTKAILSYTRKDPNWEFKWWLMVQYVKDHPDKHLSATGKAWLGLDKLFAEDGKTLNELAAKECLNAKNGRWMGPKPSKSYTPTWDDEHWDFEGAEFDSQAPVGAEEEEEDHSLAFIPPQPVYTPPAAPPEPPQPKKNKYRPPRGWLNYRGEHYSPSNIKQAVEFPLAEDDEILTQRGVKIYTLEALEVELAYIATLPPPGPPKRS